jgi:hypothetical protein
VVNVYNKVTVSRFTGSSPMLSNHSRADYLPVSVSLSTHVDEFYDVNLTELVQQHSTLEAAMKVPIP